MKAYVLKLDEDDASEEDKEAREEEDLGLAPTITEEEEEEEEDNGDAFIASSLFFLWTNDLESFNFELDEEILHAEVEARRQMHKNRIKLYLFILLSLSAQN